MTGFIYRIPLLREFVRQWKVARFRKRWRQLNPHNHTTVREEFPVEVVKVGKGTYGDLHILSYLPDGERLEIGNYVSIAPDVHFILGGNHTTNTLFTYPIRSTIIHAHCREDAQSRGSICVEDEVWIGYGATILSGVRIGKGAVIGAKAVVTKDIPPYAIAVGNPAKVVRTRIPEQYIPLVKELYLKDIPEQEWQNYLRALYTTIKDDTNVEALINEFKNL